MKMRKRRTMPKVVSFDDYGHWRNGKIKSTMQWGIALTLTTQHCKLRCRVKDIILWRKK